MNKKPFIDLLYCIATQGDEIAFRKLYYMYFDRMFRFAMHLVKSEEWSEEVVSDVFFNIWQSRQQLLEIEYFEAYLYTAIKNKSLHYIDKIKRRPKTDELSVTIEYIPDTDDPENAVINKELSQVLQMAVESLPERCRIIFKLVREDGLKYKQIAEILGISVKTIDTQMAIATRKIETIIKKYYKL